MNRLNKTLSITTLACVLSACNDGSVTIQSQSYATSEDTVLESKIVALADDGSPLTYSVVENVSRGVLVLGDNGNFTYEPEPDFFGTDQFKVSVAGSEQAATKQLSIDVTSVNDAPRLKVKRINVSEDSSFSGTIEVEDPEGDEASYTLISEAEHGVITLDTETGQFTYTPEENFYGEDKLQFQLSDGTNSDNEELIIEVENVNDAPELSDVRFFTAMGETLVATIVVSDPDPMTEQTFEFQSSNSQYGTLELCTKIEKVEGQVLCEFTFDMDPEQRVIDQVEALELSVSDGSAEAQATLTLDINSDLLYSMQWHLNNVGQKAEAERAGIIGFDINVTEAHQNGDWGQDINVAVVDSGLAIAHEDLVANVLPNRSRNFVDGSSDPTPPEADQLKGGDHGTSVAGLIASVGFNGIGTRGVAPAAKLMGFNFLAEQSMESWLASHGQAGVSDDALIVNQSYGASAVWPAIDFDSVVNQAEEGHLTQVTATANDGRGIAFVKSAGNDFGYLFNPGGVVITRGGIGFDFILSEWFVDPTKPKLSASISGMEQSNSSFYNIVVSALNAGDSVVPGNFLASYSTVGSSVWVSAPGGEFGAVNPAMVTVDLEGCDKGYNLNVGTPFHGGTHPLNPECNYTSTFNGTSSAAPVASGAIALLMAANPALTWRDAKDILARTADKIDPNFQPINLSVGGVAFAAEPGWLTNAAGLNFHNWYGFGRVNASAAVALAKSPDYQPLPPVVVTDFIPSLALEAPIPETATGLEQTVTYANDLTVEAVQLKLTIEHGRDVDLAIELISPSGTASMVVTPGSMILADQSEVQFANIPVDFVNSVMLSNAFYGEPARGDWRLRVTDTNSGVFTFYGFKVVNNEGQLTQVDTVNNATPGILKSWAIRIYGH